MPDATPKRVLYVHRTQGRGAEGVHISSVIREWRKAGWEVRIVSPPGVDPMKTPGEKPLDKTAVRVTGFSRLWKTVSTRLPQRFFEIAEIGYNFYSLGVILFHVVVFRPAAVYERYAFFHVSGALASRMLGVPFLLEVNEVSGVKRARRQAFLRTCGAMERYVFRRARFVFPVSSFLKERIADVTGSPERILVVPNAVDSGVLDRETRRADVRRRYALENQVVLGFAGWFDEWDRLDLLLQAWERIGETYALSVLFIGDGPVRMGLEGRFADRPSGSRVVFTGPVARSEIFDHLDAIDIPVFAHSNAFGSPVVLFELMALGKPVVAPRLKPFLDVIEEGVNGILFDPLDTDGLERAVAVLAGNPSVREAMGAEAKRRVRENHTWERNAMNILRFSGVAP